MAEVESKLLYSPHAEEAIIGAAVTDAGVLDLIDLAAGDFYISRNAIIWESIQFLFKSGKTLDFVVLCDHLDGRDKLSEVGGPAYITRLIAETPSSQGAADYAAIVRDLANRRHVIRVATELVQKAYLESVPLSESISGVMTELTHSAGVGYGAVHWQEYLSLAYDRILERSQNPNAVWGIPTGFMDYDSITGGLQLTELLLLSGIPGIGKSRMVLQAAVQMAKNKHPGAIYSLEMLGEAVSLRAMAAESGVESRRMKTGKLIDGDWEKINDALETLAGQDIYMSDSAEWTTAGLRADLARLKRQNNIEWFVVDYSYLLRDGVGKLDETERTQLVCANLKMICKSLRLAGIAIHSLTKTGQDSNSPSLTGLRGSGQIGYDADVVLNMLENKTGSGSPDPNLVMCAFGKGRELDNDRKCFYLVRLPKSPFFGNYTRSPMQPGDGKLKGTERKEYVND